MSNPNGSRSLREALEQLLAAGVFTAVAALVVGGTIVMCL